MAAEAFNAKMTVDQLVAAKEAAARAKAEAKAEAEAEAAIKATRVPTAQLQLAGDLVNTKKEIAAPASGVKRSSGGSSAPSAKRVRRPKPEVLGTCDG